ncbi:MAG: putative rane protein TadE -like protein [Glaciihabitans sp.]|nr:putative rane protein TadE -like protein [Glaciihabitans sp.]
MRCIYTRLNRAHRKSDSERGSTTLELTIWAVPLVLFIGVLIVGGRVAVAGNAVQGAAYAAAREATLARTVGQAEALGREAANFSLNSNGVTCSPSSVTINTSEFDKAIGTTGSVTATVRCTVNLSDAGLPGLPGTTEISRDATSPVDPYRQRS